MGSIGPWDDILLAMDIIAANLGDDYNRARTKLCTDNV